MTGIADALRRVAHTADTPAIGERGGRMLTYGQLDERTDRLANALLGTGLTPGDTVGAWMEDCHEYFELYLAVAKAGLIIVPVNARFKSEEARYALERADVRALFFTDGLAPLVEQAVDARELRLVATTGTERPCGAGGFEDLLAAASPNAPSGPAPAGDAPLILAFTSGTTGYPKAAVLTQRSVVNVCRSQVMSLRMPLRGVRAHTNSMSFTSSVTAHLLATLYVGGTSILLGKNWDMDDLFALVEQYGVTHTTIPSPLVPDFIAAAETAPERLATIQSILHAGSKVDPDLLRHLGSVVGPRLVEAWGMTENSGGLVCATSALDAAGRSRLGGAVFETVGQPVPETTVEVIDDQGRPLPHDGTSIGELVVRSPCLVDGYWKDQQASQRAFQEDGYHSGDLGSIDEFGYIRIADRRADLIVSGGMNVYPAEVERVIQRHAAVRECAVTGAPHPRWGQTVVAVVVAKPGAELSESAVIELCRENLASYKKPTAVVFVDRLPRNASDKVRREDLRRLVSSLFINT